jgi:hypothetical protein
MMIIGMVCEQHKVNADERKRGEIAIGIAHGGPEGVAIKINGVGDVAYHEIYGKFRQAAPVFNVPT